MQIFDTLLNINYFLHRWGSGNEKINWWHKTTIIITNIYIEVTMKKLGYKNAPTTCVAQLENVDCKADFGLKMDCFLVNIVNDVRLTWNFDTTCLMTSNDDWVEKMPRQPCATSAYMKIVLKMTPWHRKWVKVHPHTYEKPYSLPTYCPAMP